MAAAAVAGHHSYGNTLNNINSNNDILMNTNHNLFELNNNLIDNCSDTSTSKLQITPTTATSHEVQNIISIQNN